MCTLTWRHTGGQTKIYFNRDEKKSRIKGSSLKSFSNENGSWLCPIDPKSGGTWLGVHSSGFGLALLNDDMAKVVEKPLCSRGKLITRFLEYGTYQNYQNILNEFPLDEMQGFKLHIFNEDLVIQLHWDGLSLNLKINKDIEMPVCSSSLNQTKAISFRRELLKTKFTKKQLDRFHLYQDFQSAEWSPLMSREDAQTVSMSEISLKEDGIDFYHLNTPFNYDIELINKTSIRSFNACEYKNLTFKNTID